MPSDPLARLVDHELAVLLAERSGRPTLEQVEHYAAAQRVLRGDYTWLEAGIIDPSGDGPMIPERVAAGQAAQEAAGVQPGDQVKLGASR